MSECWWFQNHPWGVIFEIAFRDSDAWVVFRHLPAGAPPRYPRSQLR